jgi:hypothetical protein
VQPANRIPNGEVKFGECWPKKVAGGAAEAAEWVVTDRRAASKAPPVKRKCRM